MKVTRRAARLSRKHERLALPSEGALRLGVVADTHSSPHPRTLELLRTVRPAAILHAGDIGDFAVLRDLATVAPVIAVRGNIDPIDAAAPDVFVLDLGNGELPVLRVLLTHIAVNGPVLRADAARLARDEKAGLVICGHSHVPFIGRDRGIAVFNPGSVGPRRFMLPIVFGLLEVSPVTTRMSHIDCETGQPWFPPAF
ncbi:MAG TPA: metallophosphoesterase family protein [Polyangiaceae bacterium]|nr:metallophosphoesterase family protein [Polyangiaceae bacterium]